jgi:hypothetical protein
MLNVLETLMIFLVEQRRKWKRERERERGGGGGNGTKGNSSGIEHFGMITKNESTFQSPVCQYIIFTYN